MAWQRLVKTTCWICLVKLKVLVAAADMFWGYAPALDLLREIEKKNESSSRGRIRESKCSSSDIGGPGTPPFPDGGLVRGDATTLREDKKPTSSGDNSNAGGVTGSGSRNVGSPGRPNTNEAGDYTKWQKESVDLFSRISEGADSSSRLLGEDCIRVLLVGSCDARHIFKTISRLHHHPGHKPVRFYILDPLMEMVARQLLLLYAALQTPKQLGPKEKVRLLMEITGNTLIRPVTAAWITRAAKKLQKMVTNETFLREKMPQVWLDQLRYQERDKLEDICSFWQGRPQTFRIGYHWDERLRKTLKTRYDLRANAFDWDYYMILKDLKKGDRICMQEYKNWRSNGVAFTWLEAEPSVPNMTLATGIFREGGNLLHHGYLGDLRISPYIAYSIEVEAADEKDMWVKRNDGFVKRSTDVTERHLSRITFEMLNQQPYTPPVETETAINGVVITQVTDLTHMSPTAPPDDEIKDSTIRTRHNEVEGLNDDPVSVPVDVQIIFLSARLLRDPGALRRAFDGKLDAAVVASVMAETHVHEDLLGAIRDDGLLLVEGSRFHLLRKADREENAIKLVDKIKSVGFLLENEFDSGEDDYARFRVPVRG